MSDTVTLTINGRAVQAPKGMGLVEAAALAGIEIPVFCHHRKLKPVGVCRMCLVEVEGQRKPVPACTTQVADGMVVRTESDLIRHLRQGVLEFLLLNHPLDCPVCDKGGECPLQDNTFKYGPATSRLSVPKMKKRKAVDLGNFIVLDEERCILCRRCTRFDAEVACEGTLVVGQRAHEALITTADGETYDSYFSGNVIELCPVGALTSKAYRFKGRPWDLSRVPSVCTACPVGCNIELDFRFGELARVLSRENPEVDNGWLCDRGRFNYRYVHSADRVTQPLLRRGDTFVPVSWTEALMEIASRLRSVVRDHGPEAVGFIGGGRLTNEEAYTFQKLAREAVGTPHIDHRVAGQKVTSWAGYPGRLDDIDGADVVVLVDVLPAEQMPVADLRIRRAAQRGAALLALGPAAPGYRVPHTFIPVMPAGLARFLEEAASLVAEGEGQGRTGELSTTGAPAGPGPAGVDGQEALVRALRSARRVVAIWGGTDAAVGRALERLLNACRRTGDDRRLSVLIPGEQANSRGAEAMGVRPDRLPGHRPVEAGAAGLDTAGMLQAAAQGRLHALYLVGANLQETYPDGRLVREALSRVPFLVVQDLFLTETARQADVVLPAAPFAAKSGTYVNLEGRVQEVQEAQAAGENSRTDGDIFRALAEALGRRLDRSSHEIRWEVQHLLEELTVDGFVTGAALPGEAGAGAPAPAAGTARGDGNRADGRRLELVAVSRLYGGGGTARFDPAFSAVRPRAEAIFHPDDAAELGIAAGDPVELSSGPEAVTLPARISPQVVKGTVQVPRGAEGPAVNMLLTGGWHAPVTVRRRVLEEVG
ncbi:MAG: NADH-quinone oxidoreductase subunit NuoG [Firmicutes bacterium]|nr:NADH-quinone oxidoreductase subunit NuoG [Bacillota bacterium]